MEKNERTKLAESIMDILLSSQKETLDKWELARKNGDDEIGSVLFPLNFELAVQMLIGNKMPVAELLQLTRWYTPISSMWSFKYLYIQLHYSFLSIRNEPVEITEQSIKEVLISFLEEKKIYVVPFVYHKIHAGNSWNDIEENRKCVINKENMPYGLLNHSRLRDIEVVSTKYFNRKYAVDYSIPQYFATSRNAEIHIDFTEPDFKADIKVNTDNMRELNDYIRVYIVVKKSENIKVCGNASVEIFMATGLGVGFMMKCYTSLDSHFTMLRDEAQP